MPTPALATILAQAPDIGKVSPGGTSSSNEALDGVTLKRFLAQASAICAAQFNSPRPGDKTRHAGHHHSVESDLRRDAVPNLLHGVFRKAESSKFSWMRSRVREVVRNAVPRCTAHAIAT